MGDTGDTHPVRVWCDGCYDTVHYGHANSLRQAKSLGDQLVVGVHSDQEIYRHKGPTVFTQTERVKMLRANKWVHEVVPDAPYITTLETLDKHRCDFCAHGDDITYTVDGEDAYREVKAAGRYREVDRTRGVSTTDVVDRILQMERNCEPECQQSSISREDFYEFLVTDYHQFKLSEDFQSDNGEKITTIEEIPDSLREIPNIQTQGKVVYVPGAFDLFHVGHLDFLQEAAAQGMSLIVGLHSDQEVKRCKGNDYPIMSLYERALTILPCKYVSKVVLGAPYTITESFIQHYNIDLVCHGETDVIPDENGNDPYIVPKQMDKFVSVKSKNEMTTEKIVDRVFQQRSEFEERNRRKKATENQEAELRGQ